MTRVYVLHDTGQIHGIFSSLVRAQIERTRLEEEELAIRAKYRHISPYRSCWHIDSYTLNEVE